uniref:Uncharacterized protein n=1 Tax=Anguilla anguilla TaxID=7936 RepID=A0A0E9X329_ANGAN
MLDWFWGNHILPCTTNNINKYHTQHFLRTIIFIFLFLSLVLIYCAQV